MADITRTSNLEKQILWAHGGVFVFRFKIIYVLVNGFYAVVKPHDDEQLGE